MSCIAIKFIKFCRSRRDRYISYCISYTGLGSLSSLSLLLGLHLFSHSTRRPIEADREARARRLSSPHSLRQL